MKDQFNAALLAKAAADAGLLRVDHTTDGRKAIGHERAALQRFYVLALLGIGMFLDALWHSRNV